MSAALTDLRITLARRGGDLTLVDGVTLAVESGRILGIVGETGAGKTLTAKAMLGLLPSAMKVDGELTINGEPVEARSALRRRLDVAAVLQNPVGMLDPLMRVGPQLVEAVVEHRTMSRTEAQARAVELLERLGFANPQVVLAAYPHQLSGGMAQRTAIAMALMPRPELLVVDEPTSALDANLRVEILSLFSAAARDDGAAVVLVSHDLALVARYCDAVAVMYAGRVVEHGPVEAVLARPLHPYTSLLMRTGPSLASAPRAPLPVIAGSPPRAGEWAAGCVFAPRCPYSDARCHAERPALRAEGASVAACHYAETLELTGV
jgi:oligopeptide/dipeptide ABC transporter ATP-binding protein